MKIGIIGMGAAGLSTMQNLYEISQTNPAFSKKIEVHIFDPAKSVREVGGQVKTHLEPIPNTNPIRYKASELGAVITFPSWVHAQSMFQKYNMPLKEAPFATERFKFGGKTAPVIFHWYNIFSYIKQYYRYCMLYKTPEYKKMLEEGTHQAPRELLELNVGEWADKHNFRFVVELYQEFFSGCGYGQDIWSQPALYAALLLTPAAVWELIKNGIGAHKVKAVEGGYQSLWVKVAETLEQVDNFHFHYETKVSQVIEHKENGRCSYELITPTGVHVFDQVVFAISPEDVCKIFSTAIPDQGHLNLLDTLKKALCFNYQVALVRLKGENRTALSRPSGRFFYESVRSKSDVKFMPVLDIDMYPEKPGEHSNIHMLYFYGGRGDNNISADQIIEVMAEYGCEVLEIIRVANWDQYHPHFDNHALKEGALNMLHAYNNSRSNGAQIIGGVNTVGIVDQMVLEGKRAAGRLLNRM